jgi:HAD superfamily hydrolase (TIGR01458 family)
VGAHVTIRGFLLDMDGVLVTSWDPIPGAREALERLRRDGYPFRIVTNTTSRTRRAMARTLRAAGFDVDADEVITATVGTTTYLREHHPGARCLVINDGDAGEDLAGVTLAAPGEEADVVVLGGAGDGFDYAAINHAFRLLRGGAALVAMHRNLYWRTAEGDQLDGGAYVRALEEAAGVEAVVCGKPAAPFFEAALEDLGLPREEVAMVGDDVVNDVLGAQAVGIRGVLVRTGKFRPEDLERTDGSPDHVIDSIADLPGLPGAGGSP